MTDHQCQLESKSDTHTGGYLKASLIDNVLRRLERPDLRHARIGVVGEITHHGGSHIEAGGEINLVKSSYVVAAEGGAAVAFTAVIC